MNLNLAGLNNAIASALSETNQVLAIESRQQLKAKKWSWDRVTKRRSGEVVFSPRDIIDTGALYRSMVSGSNGRRAYIRYTAKHSAIVHRRRPWLRATLQEVDVLKVFANKLRAKL